MKFVPKYDTTDFFKRRENRGSKTISAVDRKFIYNRDHYKCLKCGFQKGVNKFGIYAYLTIDHIIPLSLGGSNILYNYQTLCAKCNVDKGNKTIDYRKNI